MRLLRSLPIAFAAVALLGASINHFDTLDSSGIKHLAYNGDRTYEITCSPEVVCTIGLERGEEIQDLVSPNSTKRYASTGWLIQHGLQGSRPYVYLSPQLVAGRTSLLITTTKRAYSLLLIAAPRVAHWNFVFDYIPPPTPRPSIEPSATPSPTVAPDTTRYRVSRGRLAPLSITRIDDITTIVLAPGETWPSIVARDGSDIVPVSHTDDPSTRTITVTGYWRELLLYVGTLSAAKNACTNGSTCIVIQRIETP